MAEKLTNAVERNHGKYWAKIDTERRRNERSRKKGRDGETFSYGFRSQNQIDKSIRSLKSVMETGKATKLPNGRRVQFNKEKNEFEIISKDGNYVTDIQNILDDAFEGLYLQEDIFGDYEFGIVETESEGEQSDNPNQTKSGSRTSVSEKEEPSTLFKIARNLSRI
tara:strand:- start:1062 stop:1559 length:498 start_codon:yes stop_codon:yes gene_type:complete